MSDCDSNAYATVIPVVLGARDRTPKPLPRFSTRPASTPSSRHFQKHHLCAKGERTVVSGMQRGHVRTVQASSPTLRQGLAVHFVLPLVVPQVDYASTRSPKALPSQPADTAALCAGMNGLSKDPIIGVEIVAPVNPPLPNQVLLGYRYDNVRSSPTLLWLPTVQLLPALRHVRPWHHDILAWKAVLGLIRVSPASRSSVSPASCQRTAAFLAVEGYRASEVGGLVGSRCDVLLPPAMLLHSLPHV